VARKGRREWTRPPPSPFADLKKALYAVFGQFGRIIDIVCLKTFRLRGQAWVVFADVASSSNALR